jgi:lipoprotein-anchoring transpeptidase ErfK/SrfK/outer membrane murein-binding lipoprotein Lpp
VDNKQNPRWPHEANPVRQAADVMNFGKLFFSFGVVASLLLAGCSSSGTGTSSFNGSIASAQADQKRAEANLADLNKDVSAERKTIRVEERKIAKAERQLKRKSRLSDKRRRALEADIAASRKTVVASERSLKKLERQVKRYQRQVEVAIGNARRAEKREEARSEAAKRREESRQKRLALLEERKSSGKSRLGSAFSFRSDAADEFIKDYRPVSDGGFNLPAIPVDKMDRQFLRQVVDYRTSERPGTLVVDTSNRFLYLVQGGGKAMRYGIGVGKAGFAWEGTANVAWKKEWPTWTPPDEMIARRPELAKYGGENGMKPGLQNPLGARALYIHQGGQDTLYRLHGSPEWNSIGTAASSGCIRLINQDVIDLYARVRNGAKIVVKQS